MVWNGNMINIWWPPYQMTSNGVACKTIWWWLMVDHIIVMTRCFWDRHVTYCTLALGIQHLFCTMQHVLMCNEYNLTLVRNEYNLTLVHIMQQWPSTTWWCIHSLHDLQAPMYICVTLHLYVTMNECVSDIPTLHWTMLVIECLIQLDSSSFRLHTMTTIMRHGTLPT